MLPGAIDEWTATTVILFMNISRKPTLHSPGMGASTSKQKISIHYSTDKPYFSHLTPLFIPPIAEIIDQYVGTMWLKEVCDKVSPALEDDQIIHHNSGNDSTLRSVEFGVDDNRRIVNLTEGHTGMIRELKKSLMSNDDSDNDDDELFCRHDNRFANVSNSLQVISCCNTIAIYSTLTGKLVAKTVICGHVIASETACVLSRCFTFVRDHHMIKLLITEITDTELNAVSVIPLAERKHRWRNIRMIINSRLMRVTVIS